jgi:hypothetical protein
VGHSSFQNTYDHANHSFLWAGMKKYILHFVTESEVFQHNKGETIKSPRALQPIPIPTSIWIDISMEFIVGLPKYGNNSLIMVVFDCLFKYAHFCSLPHINSNLVQYLLQNDIQKRTEKIQWKIQTLHRDFSPGNPNRENQHILYSYIVLHCLEYNIHIGASGIQNPNPMTWISPKP